MADDSKPKPTDRFAAWKKAGAGAASSTGASQDILRKAMELNPQLKGDRSTAEFFAEVQGARAADAVHKQKAAQEPSPARSPFDPLDMPKFAGDSLAAVVTETEKWLQAELARIEAAVVQTQAEAKRIDAALVAGAEHTRVELAALLRRVDPQLVSPKIAAVLNEEARFLKEIGFDRKQV